MTILSLLSRVHRQRSYVNLQLKSLEDRTMPARLFPPPVEDQGVTAHVASVAIQTIPEAAPFVSVAETPTLEATSGVRVVNTQSTFGQNPNSSYGAADAKIATAADGRGVVVWSSYQNAATNGYEFDFYGRLMNADGTWNGEPFLVSENYDDQAGHPTVAWFDVAMNASGDFVATWGNLHNNRLFTRAFEADGTPKAASYSLSFDEVHDSFDWVNYPSSTGNPYPVDTYFDIPSIGIDDSGRFVVAVKTTVYGDLSHTRMCVFPFNADGTRSGPPIDMPTQVIDKQLPLPSLSMKGDGAFVVAWNESDTLNSRVYVARFDSNFQAIGPQILVSDHTKADPELYGGFIYPQVAIAPDGGFFVTWSESTIGSNSSNRILYGRRYGASGTPLTDVFIIEAATGVDGTGPVMDQAGNTIINYTSNLLGVQTRVYDTQGLPVGGRSYQPTERTSFAPGALPGQFNAVWIGGGFADIFTQSYAVRPVIDDDIGGGILEPGETFSDTVHWNDPTATTWDVSVNWNGTVQTFTGVTQPNLPLNRLFSNLGEYRVTVSVTNPAGGFGESSFTIFVVEPPVQSTLVISGPKGVTGRAVPISWTDVPGATEYQYRLDRLTTAQIGVSTGVVYGTFDTLTASSAGEYAVRVRAKVNGEYGDFGPAFTFSAYGDGSTLEGLSDGNRVDEDNDWEVSSSGPDVSQAQDKDGNQILSYQKRLDNAFEWRARRINPDGTPNGPEWVVAPVTPVSNVEVAMITDGPNQGAYAILHEVESAITLSIYNAAGTLTGTQTILPRDVTTFSVFSADLAMNAAGKILVTTRTNYENIDQLQCLMYDLSGTLIQEPQDIELTQTPDVGAVEIAALANGNFVISWAGYVYTTQTTHTRLQARIWGAYGGPVSRPFFVDAGPIGNENYEATTPEVHPRGTGFTIGWSQTGGYRVRDFRADGTWINAPVLLEALNGATGFGKFDFAISGDLTLVGNGAEAQLFTADWVPIGARFNVSGVKAVRPGINPGEFVLITINGFTETFLQHRVYAPAASADFTIDPAVIEIGQETSFTLPLFGGDENGIDLTINYGDGTIDTHYGLTAAKYLASHTYTTDGTFSGTVTLTIGTISRTVPFEIEVLPANVAPVAGNDSFTTEEDESVVWSSDDLLINDADANDDNLTIDQINGQPIAYNTPYNLGIGTLTVNSFGQWLYTPNQNSHGEDSFTYRINDGRGEVSTATVNILVNSVLDQPILNIVPSLVLPSVIRNATNPAGVPVAQYLANIIDPEERTTLGLAVTNSSSTLGNWQRASTANGPWTNFPELTTDYMLLDAGDFIRFMPKRNTAGYGELNFIAWDGVTGGIGGDIVDPANFELWAFGSEHEVVWAPVGQTNVKYDNVGRFVLKDGKEDTVGTPFTAGPLLGFLKTEFPSTAKLGLAITGTSGNGVWQIKVGNSWQALTGLTQSNARLVKPTDSLRFIPTADENGEATLTYRAWIVPSGTPPTFGDVNLVSAGFGSESLTAVSQIVPVNDAPIIDLSIPRIFGNQPQAVSSLINSGSDIDSAITGLAITRATAKNGQWEFRLDENALWQKLTGVSASRGLLLREPAEVRFTPLVGSSTAQGYLDYKLVDASLVYVSGDRKPTTSTDFSKAIETATYSLGNTSPDFKSGNAPKLPDALLSRAPVSHLVSALLGRMTDTPGFLKGLALESVSGAGAWQYSTNAGASWQAVSIPVGSRLLLRSTDRVRYVPVPSTAETATLTFAAWDQTAGASGDLLVGSSNSFSNTTLLATMTVR